MFPDPAWPRIPCFQHGHSTGTGSLTRMQQRQSCMLAVETPYSPALTSINPSSNNTSSSFLCQCVLNCPSGLRLLVHFVHANFQTLLVNQIAAQSVACLHKLM